MKKCVFITGYDTILKETHVLPCFMVLKNKKNLGTEIESIN